MPLHLLVQDFDTTHPNKWTSTPHRHTLPLDKWAGRDSCPHFTHSHDPKQSVLECTTKLARNSSAHRTTPHATTGTTPAELLMGRPLRTLLDLMRPNISAKVENKQLSQKLHHDNKAKREIIRTTGQGVCEESRFKVSLGPRNHCGEKWQCTL